MSYQQFIAAVFPRLTDKAKQYIPRYLPQFHKLANQEGLDYAIEEIEKMSATAA